MMIVLVVFLAFFGRLASSSRALDSEFPHTNLRKEIQLNSLKGHNEAFTHSGELLAAVRSNLREFTVKEKIHSDSVRNLDDYLKSGQDNYDTTTVYMLADEHQNHIVLDDTPLHELTASTLTHCNNKIDLQVGHVLLGSSTGSWYTSTVQKQAHSLGLLPSHESKPTLALARRVTSIASSASPSKKMCYTITTESLTPLELFETIKITSLGSHPFSTTFSEERTEQREHRELQSTLTMGYGNVKVDPPLVSCTNTKYQSGVYTLGKGPTYALGLTSGCAEFNTKTNGFNCNYDSTSHTAVKKSIDLSNGAGSGMECSNCYAFMGNAFLIIINYSLKGTTVLFEVKVNGGAGVNMQINLLDPVVRGSWYKTILAAQTTFTTLNLGSSLTLKYKFGGITAEVSGTGSAEGFSQIKGGATGDVQMGVIYDGADIYGKSNNFASYVKPSYDGGFASFGKTAKFAAAVSLAAQMDFSVNSGTLFSAAGDIALNGEISMDYSVGSSSTLMAKISYTDTTTSRKLTAAEPITPGDAVPITVSYTGFNPSEPMVLTYYLETPSGHQYRVMDKEFTSHESGAGEVISLWVAPWDKRFAGIGLSKIHVSCSNLKTRVAHTQSFHMKHYQDDQSIFTCPLGQEGTAMTIDKPHHVSWKKDLLTYYKSRHGSTLRGDQYPAKRVRFVLHGESDGSENDGGADVTISREMPFEQSPENTGDASVVIPTPLIKSMSTELKNKGANRRFQRFYMTVHHGDADGVSGWSKYFALKGAGDNAQNGAAPKQVSVRSISRALSSPITNTNTQRQLASCAAGQVKVTISASYSGGISNVRVKILGELPSWTGDWPVTPLMPPMTLCYNTPKKSSTSTPVTSLLNPSCTVPKVGRGKCQDSGWACTGGSYYSGYCSGASNIKCCVIGSTTTTTTTTYPACKVPSVGSGKCMATTSCKGTAYSGYCSGASNIKCCI